MLKSYLKIILRDFLSNGTYSLIIIFGLSVGIAVCMIIAQYVVFEKSFETQYIDADRIFYTYIDWQDDQGRSDYSCHPAVGPLIKRTIPEVESVIRIAPVGLNWGDEWVIQRKRDGKMADDSRIDHMYAADPEVLEFLSIQMIEGDPHSALDDPNSIVISQSVAARFFPNEMALNNTLYLGVYALKVTGVMADPSANSTLRYNGFVPLEFYDRFFGKGYFESAWKWPVFQTFIKLKLAAQSDLVEKKINLAAQPQLDNLKKEFNLIQSVKLYPFRDFHFYRPYNNSGASPVKFTGDKRVLNFFLMVATLIILTSWANHINLSIAHSLRRAKEVGLRKVNGADRNNLILQFLLEFFLVNTIAFLLALTITQLTFDVFATAIGSRAEWMLWKLPGFWLVVALFLIISTIASGVYPAFVMSNYNPIKVLKGRFSHSQGGIKLRKMLVIVQFGLAAFLVMSIYVISRQLFFLQTKDLGMTTNQVIVIRLDGLEENLSRDAAFERWKVNIQHYPDVLNASAISNYPGDKEPRFQQYYIITNPKRKIFMECNTITGDYLKTLGLSLRCGRNLLDDLDADSTKVIITETGTRELGFENPESALGQKLIYSTTNNTYEIVGVVKDFSTSLKVPPYSSIFHFKKSPHNATRHFIVRLSSADLPASLSKLEDQWKILFNGAPFDYFFLDSYFDTFYQQEREFAGVFGFFSVVGVVITCMGLFGLSMYNTGGRIKEIGIRKSLGGSSESIVWMFSKEYLRLVFIACLITIPIGAWLLDNWLSNYPQRITFSFDFFVVPLVIIIVIAQFTVSYQTFRAAHLNPVNSLRNE